MADILGLDLKKFVEFCLSLVVMILFIVDKHTSGDDFMLVVMTFCYLALLFLMTVARRELGASTPLEAVFGVHAILIGIKYLQNPGFDPATTGISAILNIILGLMFIVFMLV